MAQLVAVGAVQVHDRHRAQDAPVVERGVVAEPGEQIERRAMAVRRGVEVQLRIRDGTAAVVVVEDLLEVADPHVVGDDREVGAPEMLFGDP